MFWPCETRTSTCRNFATISSGLYRFLVITVLLDVKDIPQVGPLQWGRITPLLTRGWRPPRPLFLAADRRHAGPGLALLAHDRAIADRLALAKHVVDVACVGIDHDSSWRFFPVVIDSLTLIGGWNPRLLIRRMRQLLSVARREIGVKHWTGLHAASKHQSSQNKQDASRESHRSPESQIRVLKFTLIVRVQSVTNRSQPMQMWVASASVRHAQHPFQQQCERTFCGSEIRKSPGPAAWRRFKKLDSVAITPRLLTAVAS